MTRRRLVALALIIVITGCGDDEDGVTGPGSDTGNGTGSDVIPAAWAGVWETRATIRDCETGQIVSVTTGSRTLCAGEPLTLDAGGISIECGGTFTEGTMDLVCDGISPVFEGCDYSIEVQVTGTRSGDRYTMSSVMTVTPEEGCGGLPGWCEAIEVSADRIAAGGECR